MVFRAAWPGFLSALITMADCLRKQVIYSMQPGRLSIMAARVIVPLSSRSLLSRIAKRPQLLKTFAATLFLTMARKCWWHRARDLTFTMPLPWETKPESQSLQPGFLLTGF